MGVLKGTEIFKTMRVSLCASYLPACLLFYCLGYIGGRMIKWLTCIEVAPYESKSHYYFHDNRL